jgi:hypothetical protein
MPERGRGVLYSSEQDAFGSLPFVTLSAVTWPKLNLQIWWTDKVTQTLPQPVIVTIVTDVSSRAVSSRPRMARDHRALATL